jgi:hypothetical protein
MDSDAEKNVMRDGFNTEMLLQNTVMTTFTIARMYAIQLLLLYP